MDGNGNRPVRVRIAPSPTGNCHVGTARNALYNLIYARQHGGAFVLRIDDTDVKRSTRASEEGVLEGLRWLGLQWDEGPDVSGPYGPYRQAERPERYRAAAERLLAAGRAYPCFCTPEELAREREAARAAGAAYRYSGRCRMLDPAEVRRRQAAGLPHVLRFAIDMRPMAYVDLIQGPIAQDAALIGDPVIYRSNGTPIYSFATVVDEIDMRISHVLRSTEHINNTFPQIQIYEALGTEPPAFGHFALLLNPDRSKISKRTGAVYIGEFRDQGYLPEAMINHLALSGWSPGTEQELYTLDELVEAFSLERCTPANAIFDRTKLLWLNGVYIRRLGADDLAARVAPFLTGAGLLAGGAPVPAEQKRLVEIAALEQERLKTLAEAPQALDFFYRDPDPAVCLDLLGQDRFARRHTPHELGTALRATMAALRRVDSGWAPPALESTLDGVTADLGWKRAELLMPVRIAVSGRQATPPLFETMACVGREAALRRLEAVTASLPA